MRRFGSVLALSLALAAPAAAGEGVWTPVGGPDRPSARLVVDPADPRTLYALVALSSLEGSGTLWKSTDGGETWRSIQEGIGGPVELLVIDPLRTERLYAWQSWDYPYVEQPQLWVSEDGGESWRVRFTHRTSDDFERFWQIVPSPLREGILFAWTDGRANAAIYRSVNGGATWSRRGEVGSDTRSSVEALSHHPTRNRLEFFDGDAFYVSRDGGLTWSVRGTYRGAGFARVARSVAAPDRLYALPYLPGICLVRSDDGGARWRRLRRPAFPRDVSCFEIVVDPHDPDLVRVLASGPVGRRFVTLLATSRDGGATWSQPSPFPAVGVAATAADSDTLFAGNLQRAGVPGLYKSTDSGQTWAPSWNGIVSGDLRRGLVALPGPGEEPILIASEIDPGALFGMLLRSADGGTSWTMVGSPTASYRDLEADAGGQILYSLKQNAGRVVKSSDGGLTWVEAPKPPISIGFLLADPYQSGRLFTTFFDDENATAKVWRTLDAAVTWSRGSSGLPAGCSHVTTVDYCPFPIALTSDPRDSNRVLLALEEFEFFSVDVPVYLSTDGGAHWHRAAKSPSGQALVLAADPGLPGAFLAGTNTGRIFRSEDGGEHWSAFGPGLPVPSAVRQLLRDDRSGAWYAVTARRGVFRSTDGGLSWSATGPGLPDLNDPLARLDPETPDHLFLAVRGQGLWSWSPPAR